MPLLWWMKHFFFFNLTSNLIKKTTQKEILFFWPKTCAPSGEPEKDLLFHSQNQAGNVRKISSSSRPKIKRSIHCKFPLSSCLFVTSDVPWTSWDADESLAGGNEEHRGLREESANAGYNEINALNYGCFLLIHKKVLRYDDTSITCRRILRHVGVRRRRKLTDDTKWHWSERTSWWKSKQTANSGKYWDSEDLECLPVI